MHLHNQPGGRRSLAGSIIGGIAETQEVIDFCAARNITADAEMIKPSEINTAHDRVVNKTFATGS
jgi:uncharacterized zinc-type alcohol dehydrogenase-like protein